MPFPMFLLTVKLASDVIILRHLYEVHVQEVSGRSLIQSRLVFINLRLETSEWMIKPDQQAISDIISLYVCAEVNEHTHGFKLF